MGQLYSRNVKSEKGTIILTGLRGGGKKKLLSQLKFGEIARTKAKSRFYFENMENKKFMVNSWTLGGRSPFDHSEALPFQEVERRMDLHDKLKNREAAAFPVSGLTGEGVSEAFSWLSEKLSSQKAGQPLNKTFEQTSKLKAAAEHAWSVNLLVKSIRGWFKEHL